MASADIIGKVLPVAIDSLERYSLLGSLVDSRSSSASGDAREPSLMAPPQAIMGA
jgi:hypothetical protein